MWKSYTFYVNDIGFPEHELYTPVSVAHDEVLFLLINFAILFESGVQYFCYCVLLMCARLVLLMVV